MYNVLRVAGDPTSWILDTQADAGQTAEPIGVAQLTQSSEPIAVSVISPLRGQLLLSPGRAGSVALLAPRMVIGWVPSDVRLLSPLLYVASTTGATRTHPGYPLDSSTDLGALKDEIMAAMRDGTFCTVNLSSPADLGVLVLNGAALSFAVICPVTPGG